jgi:hypothetical protein
MATEMRRALAGLAFVWLGAAPALADLTLRQRSYGPAGPEAARVQTQYFGGRKMVTDDARERSIVDLAAGTLTVVDKEKETYSVVAFDELRRRGTDAAERLKELPPEARRLLGLDAEVKLTPTGRSERIAGYPAREYALDAGPTRGSVWVADGLAQPEEARAWQRLSAAFGGPGRPGSVLGAELAKLPGLPLRTTLTVALGSGATTSTTEVVEIRHAGPPAAMLGVPAGFTKREAAQ